MSAYQLTFTSARFYQPLPKGESRFDAPNDELAIIHSERLTFDGRVKIVVPGEGAVSTKPQELVALENPPRVVKTW